MDGITSKENALDYWEVADAKFAILGITGEKAKKLRINMREKQFKLYDVRASNSIYGPTIEKHFHTFDAKFGGQGVTDTETKAHLKNMPVDTEFYEVKVGFDGVKRIL